MTFSTGIPCSTHYTTVECGEKKREKKTQHRENNSVHLPNWKLKPEKFSAFLPNYFSGQCAGKKPEYDGKNKSGLWAEKKPAYGRIKNDGQ